MLVDQIRTLCRRLHLPQPSQRELGLSFAQTGSITPVHDFLDTIDSHVGIRTRFRPCRQDITPVGERVRRLERHLDANIAPAYFERKVS